MNKEYVYKDGKVLIIDENGKQKETEYYDNIDEILIKENLIEEMKKRIKESENEINIQKKYKFPIKYFLFCLIGLPLFAIASSYILPILIGVNKVTNFFSITMKVSTEMTLLMTPIALGLGAIVAHSIYIEYKKASNRKRGKEIELEKLKYDIEKEKAELEELKKNKTNSKNNNKFYVKKVEDKNYIKNLNVVSSLFYDLGYNEKKYYKLYKKGKLENKLQKCWNGEAIEIANSYFEEKSPVLEKKYKRVKN